MQSDYSVLAYYKFVAIENPQREVERHREFFAGRDAKSRIYISHEGINGQMSAARADAEAYIEWMRGDPRFADVEFKIHGYHENVFPKLTIKVRRQLVALDAEVNPHAGGEHVSPQQWKEMLESRDENTIVLDVRNDYEWEIGHFEGSELPPLEAFREFPQYARELKERIDPKQTVVMMCCTGGIRCEPYSALLKQEGFEKVYQLQGGIIKYGLEMGGAHWKGKLFVFDDRLVVPLDDEAEVIGACRHCEAPSDTYFNCANVDCNDLFLACPACAGEHAGCCCAECAEAPRVRPLPQAPEALERPKPFRKWIDKPKKGTPQ